MDRLANTLVQPTKEHDLFLLHVRNAQRFYLNFAQSPTEPFAAVCVGYEHCSTDYAIYHVNFPYCTIEFVVSGRDSVTLTEMIIS
jgi:hypothetical protein